MALGVLKTRLISIFSFLHVINRNWNKKTEFTNKKWVNKGKKEIIRTFITFVWILSLTFTVKVFDFQFRLDTVSPCFLCRSAMFISLVSKMDMRLMNEYAEEFVIHFVKLNLIGEGKKSDISYTTAL